MGPSAAIRFGLWRFYFMKRLFLICVMIVAFGSAQAQVKGGVDSIWVNHVAMPGSIFTCSYSNGTLTMVGQYGNGEDRTIKLDDSCARRFVELAKPAFLDANPVAKELDYYTTDELLIQIRCFRKHKIVYKTEFYYGSHVGTPAFNAFVEWLGNTFVRNTFIVKADELEIKSRSWIACPDIVEAPDDVPTKVSRIVENIDSHSLSVTLMLKDSSDNPVPHPVAYELRREGDVFVKVRELAKGDKSGKVTFIYSYGSVEYVAVHAPGYETKVLSFEHPLIDSE